MKKFKEKGRCKKWQRRPAAVPSGAEAGDQNKLLERRCRVVLCYFIPDQSGLIPSQSDSIRLNPTNQKGFLQNEKV